MSVARDSVMCCLFFFYAQLLTQYNYISVADYLLFVSGLPKVTSKTTLTSLMKSYGTNTKTNNTSLI